MESSHSSELHASEHHHEVADSDRLDRFSELPNSLLLVILSLLPTIDVVATMLLSKRWKDLWSSVPCLDFNFWHPLFNGDSYKFLMFVSGALTSLECSNLRKFRIKFKIDDEFVTTDIADLWLRCVIEKKVEELHISGNFGSGDCDYIVPVRLYSCSSIRELYLNSCKLKVEENAHWNQLKRLILEGRESTSEAALSQVLSGAPMLEELVLGYFEIGENINIRSTSLKTLHIGTCGWSFLGTVFKAMLRIRAPNLQILEIVGLFYGSLLLEHVPSLSKAILCFKESFDDISLSLPPIEMFNHVFRSICTHVEELMLSDLIIQFLVSMKKKDMSVRFSNVKFLDLDARDAVAMLDVLDMFPELKMLKVQLDQEHYDELDTEAHLFNVDVIEPYRLKAKFPIPSLLNLKKVEITWYMRDASIIPAIEILLENAVVLEKLVFQPVWYGADRELFLCTSTSSPTAEVIIIKD